MINQSIIGLVSIQQKLEPKLEQKINNKMNSSR